MVSARKADFKKISEQLHISQILARLIRNRGAVGVEETDQYLNATPEDLIDPWKLHGMKGAVQLLLDAIAQGKRIRVIGDYDVDGICSSYILVHALEQCGARIDARVPERIRDGYGLNERLIREAAAEGVEVILTCDNGIAAAEPVQLGKSLGMTVIVTDHHEVPYHMEEDRKVYDLPPADAVIDPKMADPKSYAVVGSGTVNSKALNAVDSTIVDPRATVPVNGHSKMRVSGMEDQGKEKSRKGTSDTDILATYYPFPEICGAVVAFKLVQCLLEEAEKDSRAGTDTQLQKISKAEAEELKKQLLAFCALATVCDVMPLRGENRVFVKYGLRQAEKTSNPGLRALIDVTGLSGTTLTGYHAGFVLGPCLNASGRLDSAMNALELFLCRSRDEALRRAQELKELNDSRKGMTTQGVEQALQEMTEQHAGEDKVLVLFLPEIHESLAGIIAGRLKERFHRPAFVLTKTGDGKIKGSGRSIEAYDMYAHMNECSDLLFKFGGHKMAAGLTILPENVGAFRKRMNEQCGLTEKDFQEIIHVDMELPPVFMTKEVIHEFERLEPCGNDNPKPLFVTRGMTLKNMRVLGKGRNVIRLQAVDAKNNRYTLILFEDEHVFEQRFETQDDLRLYEDLLYGFGNVKVDMVYYPEINVWNDRESIQLIVKDFRIRNGI